VGNSPKTKGGTQQRTDRGVQMRCGSTGRRRSGQSLRTLVCNALSSAAQHDEACAQVGGQPTIHTPPCQERPMATDHSEHTLLGTLVKLDQAVWRAGKE